MLDSALVMIVIIEKEVEGILSGGVLRIIIYSDSIQAIYVQGEDKYKPQLQEQRRKHEDIKCVSWWLD
jgi:hypothetical protein